MMQQRHVGWMISMRIFSSHGGESTAPFSFSEGEIHKQNQGSAVICGWSCMGYAQRQMI